jgi:hypothetical protein
MTTERKDGAVHPCPTDGAWPCSTCGKHAHERYAEIERDLEMLNAATEVTAPRDGEEVAK